MAGSPTNALERTFPRREWFVGLARTTHVWALLSGLLTGAVLLELGLLAGLFVDRGELTVVLDDREVQLFEQVTGLQLVVAQDSDEPEPSATSDGPDEEGASIAPDNSPSSPSEKTEEAGEKSEPKPANDVSSAPVATSGEGFLQPVPGLEPDESAATDDHVTIRRFEDHGILPSVWRTRHTWWGGLLSTAFRRVSWLQHNITALLVLLAVLAATWFLRVWCLGHHRSSCRWAAREVATRLRRQMHRQSMRLAVEDVDGHGLTEAIRLFRDEVGRVRSGIFEWLTRATRYPWELVFLTLAAVSVELLLTTQWVLLTVLGGYLVTRSQRPVDRTLAKAADRAERELNRLADSLRGARLVRGYGLDASEQAIFQDRLQSYDEAVRVHDRVEDNPLWLRLLVSLACVALASFLVFVLGAKVLAAEVSAPGAVVFLTAFGTGLYAIRQMRLLPTIRADVARAADKIWRYLDQLPTVSQAVGAKFQNPLSKSMHAVDVTYRLPSGRVVLEHVDLQLAAGRSYALVSLDPLEAQAFACLLPRFIEPQSGRILFDGEDIAWSTLESLRAETLLVTARDPFLPGSVLDNIRAGQDSATLSQVTEAAKEARAHNFLSRLPQGYETILDESESQFDAGQRLRLSLARALLKKPAVLIIEEPAEGLDEDTKQLLDDTYARICPGRTVFFLPQRLSTLRRVDDIILFRHGRVEAMGPHALLVRESPLYRHWEYMHFNEFRHDGEP